MHAHYNSMNNVNHIRTFYLLHAYILSSKISLPASLKTRNHWGFKQSVVLSTRELQANSPNLNAYAERFVLSIRGECLDRFVPLSERHLRTAVTEYVVHYHTERNHQGLGNELITPLPASANDAGPIVSRERLGGILNYYCRAA